MLERELAETKQALAAARDAPVTPAARELPTSAWPAWVALAGSLVLFAGAYVAGFQVSGGTGEQVGIALSAAGAMVFTVALFLFLLARLLVVVPPNQLAVLSGRKAVLPDGTTVGYRLVRGGRVLRLPLVETVHFIDLTHLAVPVLLTGCVGKSGVPFDVEGVANVKIAGEMPFAARAVERFLGLDRAAIADIAARTLEGRVRSVIAGLAPDDVLARSANLEALLQAETEDDLAKLGLVLDTLALKTSLAKGST